MSCFHGMARWQEMGCSGSRIEPVFIDLGGQENGMFSMNSLDRSDDGKWVEKVPSLGSSFESGN